MTEITAALVKELREATNAGMLDCKKALVETNGNMEQAIDWLRKKGLATAGLVLGIVGTSLNGLLVACGLCALATVGSFVSKFN